MWYVCAHSPPSHQIVISYLFVFAKNKILLRISYCVVRQSFEESRIRYCVCASLFLHSVHFVCVYAFGVSVW